MDCDGGGADIRAPASQQQAASEPMNHHSAEEKSDLSPHKKVKPALKQQTTLTSVDETQRKKKKKKALTWDEHAIEEHDQLRGTRMKIEEPNTPYTHYDSFDGHESDDSLKHPKSPGEEHVQKPNLAMHWDTLESKLESVAAARDLCPSSPSVSISSSHEHSDDEDAKRRKAEFKKHRSQHYNEMEALRRFRLEHPGGLDDDADDDNNADDEMEMS